MVVHSCEDRTRKYEISSCSNKIEITQVFEISSPRDFERQEDCSFALAIKASTGT